jgi:hypothetical protein
MDSFAANMRRRVVSEVREALKQRGRKCKTACETQSALALATLTVNYEIYSAENGNPMINVVIGKGRKARIAAYIELSGIELSRTIAGVVDMFQEQPVEETEQSDEQSCCEDAAPA